MVINPLIQQGRKYGDGRWQYEVFNWQNLFQSKMVWKEKTIGKTWVKYKYINKGENNKKFISTVSNLHTNCLLETETERWATAREQVIHPRPQTPQGKSVAKSKIISLSQNKMFLDSSCSCRCLIYRSQVLSREWRCCWSSADGRCSNYIWVINNYMAC